MRLSHQPLGPNYGDIYMKYAIIKTIAKYIMLILGALYIFLSLIIFISLIIHINSLNEYETNGKIKNQFAEICIGNVSYNSSSYSRDAIRIWISPSFTYPYTRSPETIEGGSESVTTYLCGAIPFISIKHGNIIIYELYEKPK
jgi:hypothetical protein